MRDGVIPREQWVGGLKDLVRRETGAKLDIPVARTSAAGSGWPAKRTA